MRAKHGFTLLEISIVLLIIALLTAGIITGRALMKTATLQSIVTDNERYISATKLFREKYKELPGDFPRATEIWGSNANCPPLPSAHTQRTTCDGNADTFIGNQNLTLNNNQTSNAEPLYVWQHLSNAGLIEGYYSGGINPDGFLEPGINIPSTRVKGAGFYMRHAGAQIYTGNGYFVGQYGHVLIFGTSTSQALTSDTSVQPFFPAISASDAEAIDLKNDDGRPGTGNTRSFSTGMSANCATSDDPLTAVYTNSDNVSTSNGCSLIFMTGF